MSAPSMVTRSGDSLVIRSVVSGNQLYFDNNNKLHQLETNNNNEMNVNQNIDDGLNGTLADAGLTPLAGLTNLSPNETDDLVTRLPSDLPQCKVRRNYTCKKCNYFSQNPREYLYHIRDIHFEKIRVYECKDCLYASRHLQKLLRHMRIIHGKHDRSGTVKKSDDGVRRVRKKRKLWVNEISGGNDLYAKLNDMLAETKRLQEPVDPEESKSPSQESRANRVGKFKCSLCPFNTRHHVHLLRHEKQDHMKTKFFKCQQCEYVTHIKARFTKHVKYHSMPMIKCEACDFATPYKWNLDRHMKNHNGTGVFRCALCNFTADIKQSLTVHEMNHHNPPVGVAMGEGSLDGALEAAMDEDDEDGCKDVDYDELLRKETMLSKSQNVPTDTTITRKMARPLPNLIPIKNKVPNITSNTNQTNSAIARGNEYNDDAVVSPIDLKVRADEALDKSGTAIKDFTSMFDDNFVEIIKVPGGEKNAGNGDNYHVNKCDDEEATLTLARKNASFFDRLKEKLMSNGTDDGEKVSLTCKSCGYASKNLSELLTHKNTCGKKNHTPERSDSPSLRCHYCRQRCKSTSDLFQHLEACDRKYSYIDAMLDVKLEEDEDDNGLVIDESDGDENQAKDLSIKQVENNETPEGTSAQQSGIILTQNNNEALTLQTLQQYLINNSNIGKNVGHFTAIMNDNANLALESNGVKVGGDVVKKKSTETSPIQNIISTKKVFKCPHCSFWATTASRFHVHIVGHLNKKPFECSLCAYRSNWRWDITKHIRLKSVRDPEHIQAHVLMTDETGRRNYTKYNKYLVQLSSEDGAAANLLASGGTVTNGVRNNFSNRLSHAHQNNHKVEDEDFAASQTDDAILLLPNGLKITRSKKNAMIKSDGGGDEKTASWSEHLNAQVYNQFTFKGNHGGVQNVDDMDLDVSANTSSGGSLFKCGHCNQVSNWKHVIQRHCRLKHAGNVKIITKQELDADEVKDEYKMNATTSEELSKISATCPKCVNFVATSPQELIDHLRTNCGTTKWDDQSDDPSGGSDVIVLDDNDDMKMTAPFSCNWCPYTTSVKSKFTYHQQLHLQTMANRSTFTCGLCGYKVGDGHRLQEHMKTHGDLGEFFSGGDIDGDESDDDDDDDMGDASFVEPLCEINELDEHGNYIKEMEPDKYHYESTSGNLTISSVFRCNVCQTDFDDKTILGEHLLDKHNLSRHDELEKDASILKQLIANKASVEKYYKCPKCPEKFLKAQSLAYHQTNNHGVTSAINPLQCGVCTFVTNTQSGLDKHKKLHDDNNNDDGVVVGGMPYVCEHLKCSYQTGSLNNFINHTRRHNGLQKSASDSSIDMVKQLSDDNTHVIESVADRQIAMVLEQRYNMSSKSKPESKPDNDTNKYACPYCPYVNNRRDAADNHIKRHLASGVTRANNTCPYCDYSVQQSNHLKDHIKIHFLPAKQTIDGYLHCEPKDASVDGDNKVQLIVKFDGERLDDPSKTPELNEQTEPTDKVLFDDIFRGGVDAADLSSADEKIVIDRNTGLPVDDVSAHDNQIAKDDASKSTVVAI